MGVVRATLRHQFGSTSDKAQIVRFQSEQRLLKESSTSWALWDNRYNLSFESSWWQWNGSYDIGLDWIGVKEVWSRYRISGCTDAVRLVHRTTLGLGGNHETQKSTSTRRIQHNNVPWTMVFNKKKLSPDEKLAKALPADILLISSKPDPDHIKEEDVFAGLAASALPPAGPAGVLTRELVAAWNKRELVSGTPESWKDTFEKVHLAMGHKSVNHLPQVSSNRKVAATDAAAIVPSKKEGKKRAVLVGIEYGGKLHGCHMAVREMADYLRSKHGFSQKDITVLMDDDKAFPPTRKSILSSIHDAAKQSDEGDTVVVLFVGTYVRSNAWSYSAFEG